MTPRALISTHSIARRLTLMFALAAAVVFSITGYALYLSLIHI